MGLLGSILGMAMGRKSKAAGLMALLPLLLDNNGPLGGLSGLLEKFKSSGKEDILSSWIGNGANQSISGSQLQEILGGDVMKVVTSKLGLGEAEAADQLSNAMPDIIDKLTPKGEAPSNGLDAGDLLSMAGKLFK